MNFRQIPRFRSVGDCRNDALVVNLTFEAGWDFFVLENGTSSSECLPSKGDSAFDFLFF